LAREVDNITACCKAELDKNAGPVDVSAPAPNLSLNENLVRKYLDVLSWYGQSGDVKRLDFAGYGFAFNWFPLVLIPS
jgi:hypothetical protein